MIVFSTSLEFRLPFFVVLISRKSYFNKPSTINPCRRRDVGKTQMPEVKFEQPQLMWTTLPHDPVLSNIYYKNFHLFALASSGLRKESKDVGLKVKW